MNAAHLIDPELAPLLARIPAFSLDGSNLPFVRKGLEMSAQARAADGDGLAIDVRVQLIKGSSAGQPDVRSLVLCPTSRREGRIGILHVHGGGYVMGSPEQCLPMLRRTAHALDCVIVSVDYRLAPETIFPGALEDCSTALAWLLTHAEVLGVDPARVGVMGDSAGAGLAAALCLKMRDSGGAELAFASLMYPMLDDRTGLRGNESAEHLVWTRSSNQFGWGSLLGMPPGSEAVSPYAAPARATDLSGLPATWIGVGALDLFLDEDCDFALRLARSGVPMELHVYPAAFHGFAEAVGTGVADRANGERLDAIRRQFPMC